jgi:hypothetical protein
MLVELQTLPGLVAAQFNLKESSIVLDFAPGATITEADIQHTEAAAGYRPGRVDLEQIPAGQLNETGPGWRRINHPTAKSWLLRWLQQNFGSSPI